MTNLPQGWADRHNKMTEHDMKLGGMHATKFSAKNSYSSHNNNSTTSASGGIYNNSDQVRQFYLNESQKQNDVGSSNNNTSSSKMGKNNVPDFWENRQKEKELQAKQMGVLAKQADRSSLKLQQQQQSAGTTTVQSTSGKETTYIDGHNDDTNDDDAPGEPEVALVQIATHALDALAKSLSKKKVVIPMEDRASFAKAVKKAMDVLSKQQS